MHQNVLYLGTPKLRVSKFPKLKLSPFWMPIFFLQTFDWCEVSSKVIPFIKKIQWYVTLLACPLHARNLRRFPIFDILTPSLYFDHNLCCKYSNKSCKFIFDIYVSKDFQWHKKRFNPMNFDPSNHFLNIQKSFGTSTLKVGAHLGMCGLILSLSSALLGVWMWLPGYTLNLHLSMPFTLVTKPKLRSWHFHALTPIFWQTYV
jgi:hypothetical protein